MAEQPASRAMLAKKLTERPLLFVSYLLAAWIWANAASAVDAVEISRGPYLQLGGETTMTVVFRVEGSIDADRLLEFPGQSGAPPRGGRGRYRAEDLRAFANVPEIGP